MSKAQTDKVKHLAPWTCPKCGCWFHHYETVTYQPACVEVDGVQYDYPPESQNATEDRDSELLAAAERVLGNWERGDLAAAVRELYRVVKKIKGA